VRTSIIARIESAAARSIAASSTGFEELAG
jgi:hypothetical protein